MDLVTAGALVAVVVLVLASSFFVATEFVLDALARTRAVGRI